ncbi:Protein EMBRYO SAC DEVELOPMENT ARREST 30 [Glycine soja]|nr:Protein EMBRYO SAC DEVELOPMENT ARREST 30 [Glycine max]KAH1255590.1 Protein EMBRYO SAC DEVELOPMENT ARREST 30 [Glycine max]KAH1255591.1 Protein EMBRYO SAC DEVELOPMENT ARREST 30 [Glycine max]KAH1255592.1 Protein EMBRYO SAC DEVELOPMENT ARREST 30 [Glycine max]
MPFLTKIKWVVLSVVTLSLASIIIHLSLTKLWTVNIVQYKALPSLPEEFGSVLGRQVIKNKKLWGSIESLETLQPNANTRSNYSVPKQQSNGFLYAKVFGGFSKIRSSIPDLVAISRLLNATLVIPEIQESTRSKGISSKFKSFSYLYNEEQFIAFLKNDVIIAKSLPESLMERRRRNEFPTFKPTSSASLNFYIKEILPKLKKSKVIGLIIANGGALQSILPPSMAEIQRLRCRVAFHALQFRPEIQMLGRRMVHKLRALGQPFLAFHPGLLRETLAYNGCAELFQDVHTELIQHRRSRMIKEGVLKDELNVDSHLRREKGLCPIMPEEVGILLRVMGYPAKTIIYLAGSELFGGQRALIPLRSMFINTMDRTSLCSEKEFSDLVGPETPLPVNSFRPPPAKSENELKEEWKKAGPRPRPLPPPPGRPIYQHEKEGWYAWITETPTEPDPSPMDLRMKAHRLLWDALDYIVSLEADAFFPGFNNDGSGWPDFSSLVMGHRLYETASFRTYRPDRKVVAELFNMTRENLYHPKHNWTVLVQEHLNRSLAEEGLIRQSLLSKPAMFLSHPLPECSCRIASTKATNRFRGENGQVLYGGEDICPKWMQHANDAGSLEKEGSKSEDEGLADYESNDFVDESESEKNGSKTNQTPLWDQDEEMDPND